MLETIEPIKAGPNPSGMTVFMPGEQLLNSAGQQPDFSVADSMLADLPTVPVGSLDMDLLSESTYRPDRHRIRDWGRNVVRAVVPRASLRPVVLASALAISGVGLASPAAATCVIDGHVVTECPPGGGDETPPNPVIPAGDFQPTVTPGSGYRITTSNGFVINRGDTSWNGDARNIPLKKPIVGAAPTPSDNGYWLVASDGGIFSYGDAPFLGSTGSIRLNRPVVGMAPTPSGQGYWLVASDGGIFSYGDAAFHGSTGGIPLQRPVIGMTATPSGEGYRMAAADGGIFTYGDATFEGSMADQPLNKPVVSVAENQPPNEELATDDKTQPNQQGYWLLASDGGIFVEGSAVWSGSALMSTSASGGSAVNIMSKPRPANLEVEPDTQETPKI